MIQRLDLISSPHTLPFSLYPLFPTLQNRRQEPGHSWQLQQKVAWWKGCCIKPEPGRIQIVQDFSRCVSKICQWLGWGGGRRSGCQQSRLSLMLEDVSQGILIGDVLIGYEQSPDVNIFLCFAQNRLYPKSVFSPVTLQYQMTESLYLR